MLSVLHKTSCAFLPITIKLNSALENLSSDFSATDFFTILELNAPQNPLLEAIATTKTFLIGLSDARYEIFELEITFEKLDIR